MSRKLAISSALSVLMMAAYVLFGHEAARAPLATDAGFGIEVTSTALPAADFPGLLGGL